MILVQFLVWYFLVFSYINSRKGIEYGKENHDKAFVAMMTNWHSLLTNREHYATTNEILYFPNKQLEKHSKKRLNEFEKWNSFEGNIIPDGKDWYNHDISRRIDIMYRRRIQNLCKGNVSKKLKICVYCKIANRRLV